MIPILYEKDETLFASNGLGRLRDCTRCECFEERNGLYEVEFDYPMNGQHFDEIQIGRIVAVEHDDSGDVQPFDIVSYERPIDGVVTFHATHISYRQSYLTVTGSNINSLADAFNLLETSAEPSNPFTYETDKSSLGYVGALDGIPKTVRSILGGTEGSILDAFGGEYEFDRFRVILHSQRGQYRDFAIRYGVNMTDYTDETDSSSCYSSCIPYWTDGTTTVVGDKQTSGGVTPSGRDECIPLDVSERFENQPTKADVNAAGLAVMNSAQPFIPAQTITVSFIRLQDAGEFAQFANLLRCNLCDTIRVIFPDYNSSGMFKIVRTVWDVLGERYEEMELGDLSISLSEALGISDIQKDSKSTIEQIIDRIDDLYPVGSIYTTSTKTNPSTWIGGTWTLIDRQFAPSTGSDTAITWNSTNTQDQSGGSGTLRNFVWGRHGTTLFLRFRWYNKTALSDTSQTIATVNMATLGMAAANYWQFFYGFCDGNNAVLGMYCVWSDTTLTVSIEDVITRAATIPSTTNQQCTAILQIECNTADMADSACNQFVWKRTA